MPVADKSYFSKEHIERSHLNASSALAEQAIHCLELVAELASAGLRSSSRGGTRFC